jgi:predicted Ser/Thr protein kinase
MVDPKEKLDPEKLQGRQIGGYRILREIGRGGMGIVFEGLQESLERKVAIKVLFRETCKDPQFVARFEREAESLARMSHPNIINILDRGCQDGIYYFVMEYVDGISLRSLIEQGPLDPKEALAIIPVLCDALEYAHGEGVIHRDIKPENILIDKQGRIKIADFGLSRIVRGDEKGSRITRSNMVMGTPDYMAPEQRSDSKGVDHRADIYSLGVIFYEMLTGELPVGRFPPPSQKDIRIDIRLDDIVLRVLDKDPEQRYQRASHIATDLQVIGGSKDGKPRSPVPAPPPPPGKLHAAPEQGRTFLEILEDGWESWVLIIAIVLTVIDPLPNLLFLVAWFVLYKTMKQRRLARETLQAQAPKVPPAKPPKVPPPPAGEGQAPDSRGLTEEVTLTFEEARHALGVKWEELKRLVANGKLKAQQKKDGTFFRKEVIREYLREQEAKPVEPKPRTSFLALLSAVYAFGLVLAIPVFIPFKGHVESLFLDLPVHEMALALSVGTLMALPGVFGLLLSVLARTRVAVHPHLGGAFLATLGLIGSILFLGAGTREWIAAYRNYSTWSSLQVRARSGDPALGEELKKLMEEPVARKKALAIAGEMPRDQGRTFFTWAVDQNADGSDQALKAWAKAFGDDPESRKVLLAHVKNLLLRENVESRALGVGVIENLGGAGTRVYLIQASRDASPVVRAAAASAVEAWDDPSMIDLATGFTLDPSFKVAAKGFKALREMEWKVGPEVASDGFIKTLRESPHPNLKEQAFNALRRMMFRGPLPPNAVLGLQEASQDPHHRTKELAQRLVKEMERRAHRKAKSRSGPPKRERSSRSASSARHPAANRTLPGPQNPGEETGKDSQETD